MAKRGKRSRGERQSRRTESTGAKGVSVRAVKASSGSPATSIVVELEADRLREAGHDIAKVQEVVAEVPVRAQGGELREEQRLSRFGDLKGPDGGQIARYAAMHYGTADVDRIRVHVKMDAGTVRAGTGRVRESDKPRRTEE